MKRKSSMIIMVLAVAILAATSLAFAGWGRGYGCGGRGGAWDGPENCPRGNANCPYYNAENSAAFNEQRTEFLKETEDLRQGLYEKEMALRSEMAKRNPDAAAASNLQKEISDFRGQLSQKRLGFDMKMKKADPSYIPGRGGYGCGGYGCAGRRGGGQGRGNCWR
jgi:zinc resistance-associated protein